MKFKRYLFMCLPLCVASSLLERRPLADGSGHVLQRVSKPSATGQPLTAHQLPVDGRRSGNTLLAFKIKGEKPQLLTVKKQQLCPLCLQDSLPEKLAVYEKNIDEFDAFVDMLQ